jgi:hypothetical protein
LQLQLQLLRRSWVLEDYGVYYRRLNVYFPIHHSHTTHTPQHTTHHRHTCAQHSRHKHISTHRTHFNTHHNTPHTHAHHNTTSQPQMVKQSEDKHEKTITKRLLRLYNTRDPYIFLCLHRISMSPMSRTNKIHMSRTYTTLTLPTVYLSSFHRYHLKSYL